MLYQEWIRTLGCMYTRSLSHPLLIEKSRVSYRAGIYLEGGEHTPEVDFPSLDFLNNSTKVLEHV